MFFTKCDFEEVLETVDNVLELIRVWNAMFVGFGEGSNVGSTKLNWAFVLGMENNPDFFGFLKWRI